MFTAPTAFRAIKKEDPKGALFAQHDLAKFRTLFLAGERADPPTLEWAEQLLQKPVIDHWWQTETGWCIAGNPIGLGMLPVKHGSPTVAMPGYDVRVVDESCREVPANKMGSIVVKLPLPPACLPTLWQADQRMRCLLYTSLLVRRGVKQRRHHDRSAAQMRDFMLGDGLENGRRAHRAQADVGTAHDRPVSYTHLDVYKRQPGGGGG